MPVPVRAEEETKEPQPQKAVQFTPPPSRKATEHSIHDPTEELPEGI